MKSCEGTLNAYCEVKENNLKSYMMHDSNCKMFWENLNYGDIEKNRDRQGSCEGAGGMK